MPESAETDQDRPAGISRETWTAATQAERFQIRKLDGMGRATYRHNHDGREPEVDPGGTEALE